MARSLPRLKESGISMFPVERTELTTILAKLDVVTRPPMAISLDGGRRVYLHKEKIFYINGQQNPLTDRIPQEIWEHILRNLYPSQLLRLSMTNKNLNATVGSLEAWSHMFFKSQGTKAQLRPHLKVPRSKSYMLYMCAISLHTCEKCFRTTESYSRDLSDFPLPVPVLLPRRSTDEVTYVGERTDPNWTVRLCLPCRKEHFLAVVEPVPRYLEKSWLSPGAIHRKYPMMKQIHLWSGAAMVKESKVLEELREFFGGDVGIKAAGKSADGFHEKTEERIRWYQHQD
ncbi:hypothetical protein BGZ83_012038 [Gryganskiella cystojenkinii]|nr:hypothetical protein BGZ83_012038 [Gryganskiella cystojenkinii]